MDKEFDYIADLAWRYADLTDDDEVSRELSLCVNAMRDYLEEQR